METPKHLHEWRGAEGGTNVSPRTEFYLFPLFKANYIFEQTPNGAFSSIQRAMGLDSKYNDANLDVKQ